MSEPASQPPAAVVQVPPSDPVKTEDYPVIAEQLAVLERRLDSFNVIAGILLAGFGLLLTIIFNINFTSSVWSVSIAGYSILAVSINTLLLVSVLLAVVSAALCLAVLYGTLLTRDSATVAARVRDASTLGKVLAHEFHRRLRLVGRNRYFLAFACAGYVLELVLTSLLLYYAWTHR